VQFLTLLGGGYLNLLFERTMTVIRTSRILVAVEDSLAIPRIGQHTLSREILVLPSRKGSAK
jgi:hypothetical protein